MGYNTIHLNELTARFYIEDNVLKNKMVGTGIKAHIGDSVGSLSPAGYLRVGISINKVKKIYMVHRLMYQMYHSIDVLDLNIIIDHADGNRTHNSAENLRMCNRSQNNSNLTTIKKNNTSGYSNIILYKNKYMVQFKYQHKTYYLGTYSNINEALHVRDTNILNVHKEFTKLEIRGITNDTIHRPTTTMAGYICQSRSDIVEGCHTCYINI